MKFRQYLIYFFSLYFLSLIAIFFSAPFGESLEYGVYYSYVWSLIADSDLNLINQLPVNFSWLATMNFSDVDFHDYGNVTLLYPFFLLFSLFKPSSMDMGVFMERSFTLFNFFMAGVWIHYLNKSIKLVLKTSKEFLLPSLLFLINSSLLWYLFFQTGGSDIINGTLMTWLIYHILLHQDDENPQVVFSLIFLSFLLTIVKITFIFYIPLLFYLIFKNRNERYLKQFFLWILVSGLIIYIPHLIYNIRKFGFLYSGYYQSFNSQLFVLKGTLFSQNGYLVSSPIYWISLLGIFFIIKDRQLKSLNFIAFTFFLFVIKIILVSFRQIEDELFGPRMIMIDSFLFASLFSYCYQRLPRKVMIPLLISCTAFHFYNNAIYYAINDDWNAVYNFDFSNIPLAFNKYHQAIMGFFFKDFFLNNLYLLPLSLILTLTIYAYSKLAEKKRLTSIASLALFFYLGIHAVHNFKLERNIEKLTSEGFYQDKVVGNGPAIYYYDDLISIYKKSIFYAEKRGDQEEVDIRNKHLDEYYQTIANEVLIDPIGFLEDLKVGKYRESAHFQ